MEHTFTKTIKTIIKKHFSESVDDIFTKSFLIQYLNLKTKSVNKGSKARGSFHPLAVIYVLIEDYIAKGFIESGKYGEYEGAIFTTIKTRAAELPFCDKIQNHSFNNRVNSEFEKFFTEIDLVPILRNLDTKRYWINENLLRVDNKNIAVIVLEIIDAYFLAKQEAFFKFIDTCQKLQSLQEADNYRTEEFIIGLLAPNVDARLFEIVSYSILKYYYNDQFILWGFDIEKLKKENLTLYKTGRTNANDGGIDFVMRPLGRFFQVTETLDFKKYFLDIDKIQKYPISFVIKSEDTKAQILSMIRENAKKTYSIGAIVDKYMECIEEVINIPILRERFNVAVEKGYLNNILNEIILQSKVEFNFDESDAYGE